MVVTINELQRIADLFNDNAERLKAAIVERDVNDMILLISDFAGPVAVVDTTGKITSNDPAVENALLIALKY